MPLQKVNITAQEPKKKASRLQPVNLLGGEPEVSGLERRIGGRGEISFKNIKEQFAKPGIIPKTVGAIKAVASPFIAAEAAIANPLLAIQRELDPRVPLQGGTRKEAFKNILSQASKEAVQGIKGKRLGEIGDVFREAGMDNAYSAALGLGYSMLLPSLLIGKATKALRGIYKFTDKGIMKAGKLLTKGSDEAVSALGQNLDKAYSSINKINVNQVQFVDELSKLPQPLVEKIEKVMGNIDEITPVIENVRKVKQLIGKSKPSAFGKAADLKTTIDIEDINKSYGAMKNLIQDSLKSNKMDKAAKQLLRADSAFEEAINSSNHIKNLVVDPFLKQPTKAGKAARGLIVKGDTTTRQALTTLKRAGGQARKNINSAVDALTLYNRIVATQKTISAVAKRALIIGATGHVIGKVAGKNIGEDRVVSNVP
jgi:hypothetical protein